MRWLSWDAKVALGKWTRWFAWYPVVVGDHVVWLAIVERRALPPRGWYEYRNWDK